MTRIATVLGLVLALVTVGIFPTAGAHYCQTVAADDDGDDDGSDDDGSDEGGEHSTLTVGTLPALTADCH
jgi:hypothetical protein